MVIVYVYSYLTTLKLKNMKDPILLVDSHHGIYQPQILAEYIANYKKHGEDIAKQMFNTITDKENLLILLDGPDNEHYWDAFEYLENHCKVIIEGQTFFICQNEDTWLITEGYDFNDN